MLITTDLPVSEWQQIFQGERMTVALLDRLTYHCQKELTGESYRFCESMKKQAIATPPLLLLGAISTPTWVHFKANFQKGTLLMVSRFAVALLSVVSFSSATVAADPDLQLWFPSQLIHPIDEHWAASMQIEPRLREDISEMSALIYKPAINYHFNETCTFSFGYKYVDKYQKSDEHDLWQETHLNRKFGDLVSGFQIRLEERFSDEFSGVIPKAATPSACFSSIG